MLAGENEASTRPVLGGFRAGMRELRHVEGRTNLLDVRYAQGQADKFPEVLAQVPDQGTNVIVVGSDTGVAAAEKATSNVPIAGFSCALDQLVDSLSRRGGNLMGVTCQSADLVAKQLRLSARRCLGSGALPCCRTRRPRTGWPMLALAIPGSATWMPVSARAVSGRAVPLGRAHTGPANRAQRGCSHRCVR